jgi:TonB family protein
MKSHFPFSPFCIIAATIIFNFDAVARPYSEAERKAMFVRAPAPDYPYEARRAREEGTGLFRLFVDEQGRVTVVTVLKSTGHQVLDSESLRVLKSWRTKPGAKREVDVPLKYVLGGAQRSDNGMGKDGLGIMKSRDR